MYMQGHKMYNHVYTCTCLHACTCTYLYILGIYKDMHVWTSFSIIIKMYNYRIRTIDLAHTSKLLRPLRYKRYWNFKNIYSICLLDLEAGVVRLAQDPSRQPSQPWRWRPLPDCLPRQCLRRPLLVTASAVLALATLGHGHEGWLPSLWLEFRLWITRIPCFRVRIMHNT
jgi:hypothetical protein